jgi:hypothetical protein
MKFHPNIHSAKLATLVAAVLLTACGGPEEDSASLKQARKVQHEIERLGGEVHEGISASFDRVQELGVAAVEVGDSSLALQLRHLEARLRDLDGRFHTWSDEVVPLPGGAHQHDHDDHGSCDHDHSKDHALDGLGDDEVLAIQSALKEQLDSLSLLQHRLEERISRIVDHGDQAPNQ